MAKRIENWIAVKWIGGKFDGVVYDINRHNTNAKPPFKLGQIVELKKFKALMLDKQEGLWEHRIRCSVIENRKGR